MSSLLFQRVQVETWLGRSSYIVELKGFYVENGFQEAETEIYRLHLNFLKRTVMEKSANVVDVEKLKYVKKILANGTC